MPISETNSIRIPRSQRGAWSALTLFRRNWLVLVADRTNLLLLLGQPVLVAFLLTLAAGDSKDAISKKLFLAGIAVSWLACNNAAQSIVKERAVFLREKLAGLPTASYLASKFFMMGILSIVQALILYGVLAITGSGLYGDFAWQLAGFIGGALAMTGVGLLISSMSRTTNQALLVVPLAIIPQILLAGYVFPLNGWRGKPLVILISSASPSYAVQRFVDVSMLWGKILDDADEEYTDYVLEGNHRQNLQEALPGFWARLQSPDGKKAIPLDPEQIRKAVFGLSGEVPVETRKRFERGLESAARLQMYPNLTTVFSGMPMGTLGPETKRALEFRHWEALWYPAGLLCGILVLSFGLSWWSLQKARK